MQFGRRVDRPDYHELVPFKRPLSPTIYFEGNPNLKPDLNWHSEISWAWQDTYRFGSGKLNKTQSKSGSEEEQHRAGN